MIWLYKMIATSSDAVILLVGAAGTAVLALVITLISRRILFSPNDEALEGHSKLAELVHGSLLAFSVFVLALLLTEVRANLGKADDMELREASLIARFMRDIDTLGGEDAAAIAERVKGYVRSAVTTEWKALAQHEPALSPETTRAMASLAAQVHGAAARARRPSRPCAGTSRSWRSCARAALKAPPNRSRRCSGGCCPCHRWAMVMNGRHRIDLFGLTLIAFHMGAIGLVVAMILVMDAPFRGETVSRRSCSSKPQTCRSVGPVHWAVRHFTARREVGSCLARRIGHIASLGSRSTGWRRRDGFRALQARTNTLGT